MANDCIFCRIVTGEIPSEKLYEDENVFAFLDIAPISPGHCLVIPKTHYDRLDQCPAELVGLVAAKLGAIARAVLGVLGADGYNILNNNGRAAGQLVGHLHFHIIPRISGDGVFSRWPAGEYPVGRAAELADQIKKAL